ncbi:MULTISPECIES: hypothetical protein [Paenibacillus]|nr:MULTISPECIES: hypothetical protein [Paenibacillus]
MIVSMNGMHWREITYEIGEGYHSFIESQDLLTGGMSFIFVYIYNITML